MLNSIKEIQKWNRICVSEDTRRNKSINFGILIYMSRSINIYNCPINLKIKCIIMYTIMS